MPVYSLPDELAKYPIKEVGFKVVKLLPIGQEFNLFNILRDDLIKPYFPNIELDPIEFQVLMQYDLTNEYMNNSFYQNIETFLLNEGIIEKKGDNKFIATPKVIELRKFKSFEEFENPIGKKFRKWQITFNTIVGIGAILGGIGACISAVYAYKTYKAEYSYPPKSYPLDIRVRHHVVGQDTLVLHDTVYMARPSNKELKKK